MKSAWIMGLAGVCLLFTSRTGLAQFGGGPGLSGDSPADNRIAKLGEQLENGSVRLERDDRHGYLKSLLRELEVPISSQTLVFSKTSFQRDLISPASPRAVYFGDDVYV